jgi:glycerophosphoryl diester phosphodiesterase
VSVPTAPIVIAHRGASGYRPEHTLEAYALAIAQGADWLEPDLVSTADGVLVARHENEIGRSTDIASRPEFADRRTTKDVEGEVLTGWFTEDLTFAELRTLRAVEPTPDLRPSNTVYDGQFLVPSLDEVLTLAQVASRRLGRQIGICTEAKAPTYFRSIGLALEPLLVERMHARDLRGPGDGVLLQSFTPSSLLALAGLTDLPLMQLLWFADFSEELATPAGLAEVAGYASAVGPEKDRVLPRQEDGSLGAASDFVDEAHAAGLDVHAYTFSAETECLPTGLSHADELRAFAAAGVDGVFTDHPDLAVSALDVRRRAVA